MPRSAVAETAVTVRGATIPKIGLGTWKLTGRACTEAVRDALELGYRHVDTARAYGNEEQVGQALHDSGLNRDEVFVTTKVAPGELSAVGVHDALEQSLRALRSDYVDLLLIHWPDRKVPLPETLGAMVEAREAGRARHLGVSNFSPRLLEQALALAPVVCNQVEYHPYLPQPRLLELARERELAITAYSPLARGALADDPTIAEIARRHGRTPAQVVLRWLLDQPLVTAVPKAATREHRAANIDVFDLELGDDDRGRIAALAADRRGRRERRPG